MLVLVHIDFVAVNSKLTFDSFDLFLDIVGHHDLCDRVRHILDIGLLCHFRFVLSPVDALLIQLRLALFDLRLLLGAESEQVLKCLPHDPLDVDPLGR